MTMRDPQQLSEHLEGLVKDVEQTEETVREVENIFDDGVAGDERHLRRCPRTHRRLRRQDLPRATAHAE